MEIVGIVFCVAIFLAVLYFAAQYSLSLLFDCYVADEGVEFRLFRLMPIWLIRYEDISEIRRASWADCLDLMKSPLDLWRMPSMCNRSFSKRVLIVKRCGFAKAVGITPRHAEAFVEKVREHLRAQEQSTVV